MRLIRVFFEIFNIYIFFLFWGGGQNNQKGRWGKALSSSLHVASARILRSLEFDGQKLFCCFVQSYSIQLRLFLVTALPVLVAPHSLPYTGFSFPHLLLLPATLPSSRILTT